MNDATDTVIVTCSVMVHYAKQPHYATPQTHAYFYTRHIGSSTDLLEYQGMESLPFVGRSITISSSIISRASVNNA